MQRCGEFRESKEDKKSEAHPAKPEKGETGCVSGAGGDEDGWEQQKPGEETRRGMHPIPIQLMQKGNRRKPSVSAGFAAGTEGLGHACCPGCRSPMGSAQHWPRREPRPARQSGFGVDVGTAYREWGSAGVGRFRPKSERGRVVAAGPPSAPTIRVILPIQEGHAWGAKIAGNLSHLLPCVAGVNQSFASEHTSPVGGLFFQCTRGIILSKS